MVVPPGQPDFDRTAAAESLSCLSGINGQQWPAVQHPQPVGNIFGDIDQSHVAENTARDVYHQSLLGPQMFSQGLCTILLRCLDTPANEETGEEFSGFDQFREFADFLDGIGLPAEWSPYFNPPEDFVDPNLRDAEGSNSGSGPATRPGTPFSSWLPSAPAGNRITGPTSTESKLTDVFQS